MADKSTPVSLSCEQLLDQFKTLQQRLHNQTATQNELKQVPLLAQAFLQLAKNHPVFFISLLHSPIQSFPFVYRWIFNSCLLTTILCLKHRWHDNATTQLLCACLTLHCHRLAQVEKWCQSRPLNEQDKQTLIHPFTLSPPLTTSYPIWSNTISLAWQQCSHPSTLNKFDRYPVSEQIVVIANLLALLFTPGKARRTPSYAETLKLVSRKLPTCSYQVVEYLLQITGIYPPGTIVELKTGERLRILSLDKRSVVGKFFSADNQAADRMEQVALDRIRCAVDTDPVENITAHLNQWWDKPWQEMHRSNKAATRIQALHFRIDIPPPTLMEVSQQLDLPEPDTKSLCQLISSEKSLADYLQLQASINSRLKLTINNVKQAILMNGFQRTYSMLNLQALNVRLTQHHFPVAEKLTQFSQLRSAIAGQLARQSPLPMIPEEAECLAAFASAGLMIHPQLRAQITLPLCDECTLDITRLFNIGAAEQLRENAIKLAQYWHLHSTQIDAIRFTGLLSSAGKKRAALCRQLAAILGLSLIMAQRSYLNIHQLKNTETKQEYALALNILQLEEHHCAKVLQSASELTNCYTPQH